MKLLFVTHWANNMLIFRTWMLQEAVRRGHEVYVLCPPDLEAAKFAEIGVKHIPWKLRRGGGVFNLMAAITDARSTLRTLKPDSTVVYCVQPIMAMLWAWKLGGRSGKLYPTFTGLGSLWTDLEPASWKKRLVRGVVEWVFGAMLQMATKISVQNNDDMETVRNWGRKPNSFNMTLSLGEGVDKDIFRVKEDATRMVARLKWGIPSQAIVVGFVGRLIKEKGALDLLALSKVIQKLNLVDMSIHFLVVGDRDVGNPSSLSDDQIKELLNIPNMHQVSWLFDVWNAYAAMDILFFPSYREGQGLVPIEAMTMGVPAIGYNVIGVKDVLPDDWRVPLGDVSQASELILQVLTDKSMAMKRSFSISKKYDRSRIQSEQLNEYCEREDLKYERD